MKFADSVALFCGNNTQCSGKSSKPAVEGGVAFWFTPNVGAIGSYLKPAEVSAEGSGDRYRFTSGLESEILTIAGAVAAPVRRARIYGRVGVNYHRARFSTEQTTDPVTVTVNEQPVILQGGTQTFEFETTGWGWVWGAGVEAWVTTPLAIYFEFEQMGLKGDDRGGGESLMKDTVTGFFAGVRFRLGRLGR